MRRNHLIAAIGCFLLCGFGECQQRDALSLIAGGFVLISPPSNLVTPGAIVMMTKDGNDHATLKILCGPRSNLGPMFMPRVSETMSSTFKLSRTQKIELEAEAVERFKARTKVEDVASVSVSLNNAKVVEVVEAEIFERIEERTEACQRAIDSRIDAGYTPTFVTSAYIADVQYTVSFRRERELSKRVREDRMGRIAANLGGGHTEVTENSLRATNLVLAIRDDPYLMSVKPHCSIGPRPRTQETKLTAPFAEVLPEPVAPYVPPAGGWASPIIGR